jgi:superoxide reductase
MENIHHGCRILYTIRPALTVCIRVVSFIISFFSYLKFMQTILKGENHMDRRTFLKATAIGSFATGFAATVAAAERFFPVKVDPTLFEGINRVKDPAKKTALEKSHAPVIIAPASVKAGEAFSVEVMVGENLHSMGPAHWIEFIELFIGNEPAGRIDMKSKGYLKPKATFTVLLPKDAAPMGKVTLVAMQHCNLHGMWEGSLDISVA